MRNPGPAHPDGWGALAWATESEVGSSAAKFILILLANKADENFSCYPSIRTLMAESNAGRSTVLRALRDLETRGFISRRPQFHDSGARRSTRYYLNHPLAPHLSPGPDAGPPRPDLGPPGLDSRRTPSRSRTGTVSERHPLGVPQRETPTERVIRCGCSPGGSPIFHSWKTHIRQPCRGVVNARTRILAPSQSLSPTEPKLRSFVPSAARKSTGLVHPNRNPHNVWKGGELSWRATCSMNFPYCLRYPVRRSCWESVGQQHIGWWPPASCQCVGSAAAFTS
jgi:hypothetical protein